MSKYKVVITDREYESIEAEKSLLEANDCEVFDYQYKDQENILRVAKDADAIIVQYAKMPKELIEQLDKCKIIARYAMGFDGIDLQAAADKSIYVCNVKDYCYEEVATHALALLLEFSRRVAKYDAWTHNGNWYAMPGKQHSLKKAGDRRHRALVVLPEAISIRSSRSVTISGSTTHLSVMTTSVHTG